MNRRIPVVLVLLLLVLFTLSGCTGANPGRTTSPVATATPAQTTQPAAIPTPAPTVTVTATGTLPVSPAHSSPVSPSPAPATRTVSYSPATTTVTATTARFSPEAVRYFSEVALGAEYGASEPQVFRWNKKDVAIRVHGSPDDASRSCLNTIVTDFNRLSTSSQLQVAGQGEGDIDLYFSPESEFPRIEPNYVPGNWGFFWYWNKGGCEIYRARILISTDHGNPQERCHLIREELTQSLGLARDSDRYPDSIFYGQWTDTNSYSGLDQDLIRMLYSTDLPSCSTEADVRRHFST